MEELLNDIGTSDDLILDEDEFAAWKGLPHVEDIIQSLFSGTISFQVAAESLALTSLNNYYNGLEHSIVSVWRPMFEHAVRSPEIHDILSELLIAMASLPPAKDGSGNQLLSGPLWYRHTTMRFWGKSKTLSLQVWD